jgi:uncharacterized protein (TIGR04222 family)
MDVTTSQLWTQIQALPLNDPTAEQTFTARLAKENGWRMAYAERVVQEYRKFLLLAKVAGHAVSPPDAIDQAWHLHILYTRSYWDDLCSQILGFKLHHEPSRGGRAERQKFAGLYAQTLQSYMNVFGMQPPVDIWPSPQAMRRMHSDFQRINKARYWIIPRITFSALLQRWGYSLAPLSLLVALPVGLFGLDLNVFNWSGMAFLEFYIFLLIGSFTMSMLLRYLVLGNTGSNYGDSNKELTPDEISYLAGGPENCVAAAIGTLLRTGQLQVQAVNTLQGSAVQSLSIGDSTNEPITEMQRQIFSAVKSAGSYPIVELKKDFSSKVDQIAEKLEMQGLTYNASTMTMAQLLGAIPMAIVLITGAIKLYLGIVRDKPVVLLVVLMFATLVLCIFAVARKFRTAAGETLLNTLRIQHATLEQQVKENPATPAYDTGLALGLFGLGLLHMGPESVLGNYFHTPMRRPDGSWQSYDNGSTSCGSSCSGGGDSGGGGDGGGGCGSGCGGCGGGGD